MSVNVKTNKDKNINPAPAQTEQAVPEVLLTPHHLVVSTLVRNASFQVGDEVAANLVRLVASMSMLLNANVANMDEELADSWQRVPSNAVTLWAVVLKDVKPYDVSVVTAVELVNMAVLLLTYLTPVALAHADVEPVVNNYSQEDACVVPDGLLDIARDLAVSFIPANTVGDPDETSAVQEDTATTTESVSVPEVTPEEIVAEYVASAQVVTEQAKADETVLAVAAGAPVTSSSYGGGGSSSDEWGVGSYLLLAAAVGAVAYGGYKLFSDGEAEDVTIADLDYTI